MKPLTLKTLNKMKQSTEDKTIVMGDVTHSHNQYLSEIQKVDTVIELLGEEYYDILTQIDQLRLSLNSKRSEIHNKTNELDNIYRKYKVVFDEEFSDENYMNLNKDSMFSNINYLNYNDYDVDGVRYLV